MKIIETFGGCLPTPRQQLLLKAGLLPPEEARAAWREWLAAQTLDAVGEDVFRLLPLLYSNLTAAGYDGEEMPRLKGVFRRNWYCNQMLFHAVEKLLQVFEARGIRTMLLKGTALSHLYYPDPAARSMLDGDIMVPLAQADLALQVMREAGWKEKLPLRKNHLTASNGNAFVNTTGQEIDLHWHLLSEGCGAKDDEVFWQKAGAFRFGDTATQTLSPTHHLFQACVHGYKWNRQHPMRWIADAFLILKKHGASVDWNEIDLLARQYGLSLRVKDALSFLRDEFAVPVPDAVLQAGPVSAFESFEQGVVTRRGRLRHNLTDEIIRPLQSMWIRQRRQQTGRTILWRAMTYPAFLADELRLKSLRHLPGALAQRLRRRFQESFFHRISLMKTR